MPGDIFLLSIHVYNKWRWRSNDIWFWNIRCYRQKLLSFWVIFCPFSPLTNRKIKILKLKKTYDKWHKWQSYDVWFLRYEAWLTKFFVILNSFLPFYNPKNQNFEKLKEAPGDIIILHKCIKNNDHMLCCSLDMARNGFNCYFSFWAIFYPFTSLTAQKIKI